MGDNFKGVRAMDPETIYEEHEFLSHRLNNTGPGRAVTSMRDESLSKGVVCVLLVQIITIVVGSG